MSVPRVFDNPHRAATSPARHAAHRERAERRQAIRTVLSHARDVLDARELLDMLGLDPALFRVDEGAPD